MKLVIFIGAIAAAAVVLLAPVAQADPARHPHDYLAVPRTEHSSAVPPDLRDHALIKQLVASDASRSGGGTSSSFSWGDAGVGAGVTAGTLLILGGMGAFAVRRRSRVAI